MIGLFRPLSGLFDRSKEAALLPNPDLAKALGACGLMVLAALLIGASALVARVHVGYLPVPKVYLASTGKAVEQVPVLKNPSVAPIKVQRWTTRTLREVFSFNFVNFDDHVASVQDAFTEQGWTAFQQGLASSNLANRVAKERLDVFLVPQALARVTKVQIINGVVTYQLQMPCLMVYKGASATTNTTMIAQVIVRQVPTDVSPDGIAISDLALRPQH